MDIANQLRDRILAGDLSPGDEVPSERALAAEWGVARPTAARALGELRRLGLVESRVGAGTFVVDMGMARTAADRFRQSSETGAIYGPHERASIISAGFVDPPVNVKLALGLDTGRRAVRRERLTLRNEHPAAWSISWFSEDTARLAPRILRRERIRQGTMLYVEEMTGRRISRTEDRFRAHRATTRLADLLQLPRGAAVLCAEHRILDQAGEVIEFSESVRPADVWTEVFPRAVRA